MKIPAEFRRFVESNYGNELFVTSLHGNEARIYPLPVWQEFEDRLRKLGPFNPIRMRLQQVVNFYGQTQTMDAQGRVLLQSTLRETAGLAGEVTVLGLTDHLYIQKREQIEIDVQVPLSDDELAALDSLWSSKE